MNIYCLNCGESWDVCHVSDCRAEFDFSEKGTGKIVGCPCCLGKPQNLTQKEKQVLEAKSIVADLLGDDVDGLASMYDDFEYLGLFDED